MNWRTSFFIVLLAVFAGWLGWRYFMKPTLVFTPPPSATPTPSPTPTPTLAQKADDVKLLLAVPYTITTAQASSLSATASPSAMLHFIQEKKPSIVTLFGSAISTKSAQTTLSRIKETAGYMPLIAVDHEGGTVQRLSGAGFTKLPSWQQFCQMELDKREALLQQSATELKANGINIVFAPVVDVAADSPVLGTRVCSDDPVLTEKMAAQTIEIYNQKDILPVIKHYPGIGAIKKDLHSEVDAIFSLPVELPIFMHLLQKYPAIGVMSTHVLVSKLSEEAPCDLNPTCLQGIQQENGKALYFSDALDMKSALTGEDLVSKKTLSQVSKEAVLAGNTVLVYSNTVNADQLNSVLSDLKIEYTTNKDFRAKADIAIAKVKELQKREQ